MGLSVAISGGIMIVAFAMVMMMFPSIANNIFSVQQVTSSMSEHNNIISNTDISTRRLETQIGSPYVNFTLVNQGAYNLWKFDSFNLYVEYDAAGPVKRTEELTFGGQCLGGVPQVRKWCIESITNDYKDPDILNLGEGARIRTTLSQNLATTNAVVTVVTDNGVINTSGYDFFDITTLETLDNVTRTGCGLNQIIKVNSTGFWDCSNDGIPKPTTKQTGWFMPASAADDATGGFGGMLSDITSDGVQTIAVDSDGSRWSTPVTTTAGTDGGVQSAQGLYRGEWNIDMTAKVQQSATTGHRMFIGFSTNAALPNSDTPCNGRSCAGFFIGTTDTEWQIVTNDGDGTSDFTACTGCTEDTLVHEFRVRSDAANNQFCFTFDALAEQCVTTEIPASTTNMFLEVEMESAGTNNSIEIYYIYVESDK